MRTMLLTVLSSCYLLGLSQGGGVVGKVVEGTTQKPLEYATITLMSAKDSSIINGCFTDSTGVYQLGNLALGQYYIEASFIGFKTQQTNAFELSKSNPVIRLKDLAMQSSTELEGVEISVQKAALENKLDKKVFDATQSEVGGNGNGLDLLRTVPLVSVDESDNILLRGDGNVTIFINGRPSAIPVSELMKQIPGSSIEKVELITNPSAKYDPEGMSGIINIVLKKEQNAGFNANFNIGAGYGVFPKTNNSVTMNYRNDKINLSSSVGYNHRKIWFGGTLDRDVLLSDDTWNILRQEDYGERINSGLSSTIGLDYFLNDKNTLYINGSYNHGENDGSRLVEYNNYDENDNYLSYSEREGIIDVPSNNYSLNAGWQKDFKKEGHHLDVDLNLTTFGSVADERLTQDYYNSGLEYLTTDYQNTVNDNRFDNYLSRIDYTLPINDSLKFESGFHFTKRWSKNNYSSESGSHLDSLTNDAGITNEFIYDQNVFAPYVTIGQKINKWNMQVGLRAEQTLTTSELITTDELFNNNYFMLFPSGHLSYEFNPSASIQLSYSKRINRPNQQQLNPFSNYSDPLVLEQGDPFLLPEVIHVNEISFLKYWEKININTTIYNRFITNMIRRNLSYEEEISVVNYSNLGKSTLAGGDFILTYLPNRTTRIVSTTNYWSTFTKDQALTGGEPVHLSGVNTSLLASTRLKKGWSFQLWGSYSPRQTVLQGDIISMYGMGLAISKSLFQNKGRISASVNDLFNTRRFGFDGTPLDTYRFNNFREWESRRFSLRFTYSVGKQIQGKNKRRTKDIDSSDDIDIPQM